MSTDWMMKLAGDDPGVWMDIFALRRSDHAVQQPDGSYQRAGCELTEAVALAHLRGETTIGLYALDGSRCLWGCLDADYPGALFDLQRIAFRIASLGIVAALELSRRGGHLWVPCSGHVEAHLLRRLLIGVVNRLGVPLKGDCAEGVEVFPKQDATTTYGNLMRGPLGVHRKTGERYPLADIMSQAPLEPLTVHDQLILWDAWPKATPEDIERAARTFPDHRQLSRSSRASCPSSTSSPPDIRGLDILAWAGQLTQLKRRGATYTGLCPFHSESAPSFVVYPNDATKPHAHCFGCEWHGDAADLKARATGKPLAAVLREVRAGV